jgi:predicted DNA-binding protein with PD1-like motif
MRHQLLKHEHGQRTFAVVLQKGDEAISCQQQFVQTNGISAAQLTGVGASADVTPGYFAWNKKDYVPNGVAEQVEVSSHIDDVALLSISGKPSLHVHVVPKRRDGTALAGQLNEAHVRPTLEVIVKESPAYLQRAYDPESGLALIRPRQ